MKRIVLIVFIFILLFAGYLISITPSYDTLDISEADSSLKASLI